MPGEGQLVQVRVGESARHYIPPGLPAIRVINAAGTSTVVIDSDGNLETAITAAQITYADDVLLALGTGTDARLSWDTTDANAHAVLFQLPAGGAVNVPVVAIGQSIESVDLGLYNGVVDPRIAMFGVGADTTGPVVEFRKARGTIASPTVVTTGDDLGTLDFYGAVAAGEYVRAASIRADMAGTIATTRGPGTLTFSTATDAAPSVLTAALTLGADQSATFGGNLLLASGAVLNFDSGDVTITHSANTITIGGASTGLVVSAGDISASATGAAFVAAAGNAELGNPGTFASTQPQGAVVMGGTSLGGVAPAGAITTAGAIFASDTVVRKIIADGTASNVET